MKYQFVFAITAMAVMGFANAAISQSAAKPKSPPPSAAPKAQIFSPGFDDLMTMLVQPRHIRLYYAGKQKNWELAAAELRDLQSSFDRLVKVIPNYQGNDVSAALKSLIDPQIQAVQAAITAADSKKFSTSFRDLTTSCNSCHTYLEHPFIVIKVPDSPNDLTHPDQSFSPVP